MRRTEDCTDGGAGVAPPGFNMSRPSETMPTEPDTEGFVDYDDSALPYENYSVPGSDAEDEASYVRLTDQEWSNASRFLSPREMKVWKLRGM